jgi:hypothetical protein
VVSTRVIRRARTTRDGRSRTRSVFVGATYSRFRDFFPPFCVLTPRFSQVPLSDYSVFSVVCFERSSVWVVARRSSAPRGGSSNRCFPCIGCFSLDPLRRFSVRALCFWAFSRLFWTGKRPLCLSLHRSRLPKSGPFFFGLLIFLARDPANLIMMVGRTDRSAQNAYVGPSPKRWKSSCGAAGDATADRGKCVEEYGLCSGGLQGCGQGIKSVLRELYERQQIAKERRLRA